MFLNGTILKKLSQTIAKSLFLRFTVKAYGFILPVYLCGFDIKTEFFHKIRAKFQRRAVYGAFVKFKSVVFPRYKFNNVRIISYQPGNIGFGEIGLIGKEHIYIFAVFGNPFYFEFLG